MRTRALLVKISISSALLIATLAMGGPVTQAAASTIVVDADNPATNCGTYTDKASVSDPVVAINDVVSGSTIVICPGTYTLSGAIGISGKSKITIKKALAGAGSKPTLTIDPTASVGINIDHSTSVTIDGLILDGRGSTQASYTGINISFSSVVVKNTALLGALPSSYSGISAEADGGTKSLGLSVTNSLIAGYRYAGFFIRGPYKMKLSGNVLDATSGGPPTGGIVTGVFILRGSPGTAAPTGSMSKCQVLNSYYGIVINDVPKLTVSGCSLTNNKYGISIFASGRSADSNKIIGNSIHVPSGGYGIYIEDTNVPSISIKSTLISNNVLTALPYTSNSGTPTGIYFSANAPAQMVVTATLSDNIFWGFSVTPSPKYLVNISGNAKITEKGSDVAP